MPVAAQPEELEANQIARELLNIRGWITARPPKGNLVWKSDIDRFPSLANALGGNGQAKHNGNRPDFLVVSRNTLTPLIVGETAPSTDDADALATDATSHSGELLRSRGFNVLATGISADPSGDFSLRLKKRGQQNWRTVEYRHDPVQWLPTPEETEQLLTDVGRFVLPPKIPSPEVLAARADQINRIFRECGIKDEWRPATIGAFMLGLWQSKGKVRTTSSHILSDINNACRQAFVAAGKPELAQTLAIPTGNRKLASRASDLCRILRLLNITNLTAEHDYLGRLYETFFRYTGGNTIGQYFTPRHIAEFMVSLCDVSKTDYVVDPACGTGGFLISSLYRMLGEHATAPKSHVLKLVSKHLIGFESEPVTAALCVANMILRGDGTTAIVPEDCFTSDQFPDESATVALGNPPFPHKETDVPPERFVDRALDGLKSGGQLAMILPISLLVKATKQSWRNDILANHTVRAVIRLPDELFQPFAQPYTVIVLLEKGKAHSSHTEKTFFCHIDNDGYRLQKNVRVEKPEGSQIALAIENFQSEKSVRGFCSWARLKPDDWAPGAYISSPNVPNVRLIEIVDGLLRNELAFSATFANQLAALECQIDRGLLSASNYESTIGREPDPLPKRANTLGALFDIYYGQDELVTKRGLPQGVMPVISASGANNGCYGFFDFSSRAPLIQPPFVTVPRTGSIGKAFVQNVACGVSADCLILLPKALTRHADLYIAAAILRLERWRFNYGRKMTPQRIATFEIPRDASLQQWIDERYKTAGRVRKFLLKELAGSVPDDKFSDLVWRWKAGKGRGAKAARMAMHPAYQEIIQMGTKAVPRILQELQRERDHWFWALHALTGETPVADEHRGNIQAMTADWLEWGRKKGHI